jgi:hypothetical protein
MNGIATQSLLGSAKMKALASSRQPRSDIHPVPTVCRFHGSVAIPSRVGTGFIDRGNHFSQGASSGGATVHLASQEFTVDEVEELPSFERFAFSGAALRGPQSPATT